MVAASDRRPFAQRLSLSALVLGTLLLPGASEADSVTYTTATSAQYQAPASRAPLQKYGGTQQAKVFRGFIASPADIATCATPTLAQCKSLDYLFTGCGQAHQATCKGLLTPSYEEHFKNIAPKGLGADKLKREMFPYGTLAQFKDLKKGKFRGTVMTNSALVKSTSFFDQTRITNAPAGTDPKTYVPHQPWEDNGAVVTSCKEYAYEKYYDWHRFQDAVSLCNGDYVCAYDIAYILNGPPGVAKRNLKRKDGQSMSQQLVPVVPKPKNVFFTMGPYVTDTPVGVDKNGHPLSFEGYLPFADLKAKFPQYATDLDELKVALDDGATYYGQLPASGVNEVFGNAWDFHSTLRTRTQNVTENEFEEFARRRGEIEYYLGSIRPVSTGGGGGKFGLREAEFVHPLQEREHLYTYDPWERTNMLQDANVREQAVTQSLLPALKQNHAGLFGSNGATVRAPANTVLRSGTVGSMGANQANKTGVGAVTNKPPAQKATKSKATTKATTKNKSSAGSGAKAKSTAGSAATAKKSSAASQLAVVASPSLKTLMAPQVICTYIPPMDVEACEKNATNCKDLPGPDAMRDQNQRNWNQYAKCKLLNLTLMEWWRRKARLADGGTCNDRGSCGCLDRNSAACDWSPKMFYDAYISQTPGGSNVLVNGNVSVPAALSYLRDADFEYCKRWTYGGFPTKAKDQANGDALEAYLAAKRAEIEAILKNIPQKKDSNGQPTPGILGEDFSDAAREGDTSSWSAGYNMASGWELRPTEFTGSSPQKTCGLQGYANSAFAVKITTPIDGVVGDMADIWNNAVNTDVWVRVNEKNAEGKGDGKVRLENHLLIADQELFAVPEPYKGKTFDQYNQNNSGTYATFNLNKTFERKLLEKVNKTPKLTLTVWAGPIPVTGSVWAELRYGVNAIAKGLTDDHCTASMTKFEAYAGFEPYFAVTGAMSLGVGIGGIVSAGIRGYVDLIVAELPIGARTWLTGEGTDRKINFGVDAAIDLSTLSGRLALYVEFLLYEEEFELFHWRGIHTNIPLLRAVNEKFDFGAIAAIAAP